MRFTLPNARIMMHQPLTAKHSHRREADTG